MPSTVHVAPDAGMEVDSASQRLAFLAAAGELLSSSLDYVETLRHVARLAVPTLGDLCMVDVVEDGELRRLATAHVRADKTAFMEELVERYPVSRDSPAPAARALRAGRVDCLTEVTPDVVAEHTVDAGHARLILAIGIRSHLSVPMLARGHAVGVISIGITESDRCYGPADIALAEELARRAALAVDNARLYQAAQHELARAAALEAGLRQSERRFRAMMEQSPLSTQLLGRDGRTLSVNRAFETLWGLSAEALGDYSVLEDAQLEEKGIAPLLRRAFAGEPVMLPEIAYELERSLPGRSRHEQQTCWVRAFAYPLRDDAGEVSEVVLVHEDVTEAREAVDALRLSEERLQRAMSIVSMNVWDWDLVRDEVTCSDNADEFWGLKVGCATDFMRVVHPDDVAELEAMAARALADDAPYDIEYRLGTAEGDERWVRSRGRVDRAGDGTPLRLLGVTMDVTQRRRAQEASRILADAGETLGASLDYELTLNQLARVVVPRLADWYAVDLLNPQGVLERVSVCHPDPARVEIAHQLHQRYPPRLDAAIGAGRVLATGQPDWAAEITDEQLRSVAVDDEHLRMLRSLGLRSYVIVPLVSRGATFGTLTLIFAESGRRYRPDDIALALDIGRRASAAVDNARLHQQLQLGDRRKDEFLAMLAHELRNPLAPISTAAQLLRMAAGTDARVVNASEIISRQVGHMTELVDDLLDVSRVTRGLVELERHAVDLKSVVTAAVEQVRPLIESRSHALSTWSSAESLVVDGDRTRLVQVVANLLNNAAKYTPPRGAIDLRVDEDGGRVRIRVQDDGAGIDPALLPYVFELFTQAERTPDRSQGGLGIGLALVRSIVQLHGGEVRAESAGAGGGSVFTVWLPRAHATAAARGPSLPAGREGVQARRVLVVDDNVDAAEVLAEVLRIEGHEVEVAATAAGALALLDDAAPFEVFILDIGLPDMTGYELASRLRARPAGASALCVALTGYGQAQDRARSGQAGFDHHLVKPADIGRVLQLIEQAPLARASAEMGPD